MVIGRTNLIGKYICYNTCVIVIPRARVLCLIYTHMSKDRRPEESAYIQENACGITNMFYFSMQTYLIGKIFSCYALRKPSKL